MKIALLFLMILFGLVGCTTPSPQPTEEDTYLSFPEPVAKGRPNLAQLQTRLGLTRSPQSLGYAERGFDGCRMGVKAQDGSCGRLFMSVVHFRVLCRDTVETTSRVSTNFRPMVANYISWKLSDSSGQTRTDNEGYGQVQLLTSRPTTGKRFILVVGSKSLGLEVGEVSRIVVPGDWCA